jgi:hypothetical protein
MGRAILDNDLLMARVRAILKGPLAQDFSEVVLGLSDPERCPLLMEFSIRYAADAAKKKRNGCKDTHNCGMAKHNGCKPLQAASTKAPVLKLAR